MLEPSVKQKILDQHEKMNSEGKLLSRQKLEQCYSLFRGRFGPDQLKSMDGETLLSSMHDHGNRESLVYWLEFKNDDEFPASFGSIAGGSALKFGVFRRADSGEWATYGDGHKPKDIPVEQAIEIARKHRDQLVKGAEVLKAFQANAGDAEYLELQQQLDQAAPDVSNLGWGHKYFSLLFPDTLDDYHSPDLQRFHLLKMLQLPPEKDGRYVCAGRFVDAGRDTNLILNHHISDGGTRCRPITPNSRKLVSASSLNRVQSALRALPRTETSWTATFLPPKVRKRTGDSPSKLRPTPSTVSRHCEGLRTNNSINP